MRASVILISALCVISFSLVAAEIFKKKMIAEKTFKGGLLSLLPLFFFISPLFFGFRKLLDSFLSMLDAKNGKSLFGIFTCRNYLILSMGCNDLSVIPFPVIRSIKADSISRIRKIEFVYFSPENQEEYCLEYITERLNYQAVSELKKAIRVTKKIKTSNQLSKKGSQ